MTEENGREFMVEWLAMWTGYSREHFEKMNEQELLEAYRRGMIAQSRKMTEGRRA